MTPPNISGPRTFTTSDYLNTPQPQVELPGLEAIAQQKFDLPYYELSPSLQSHVREEAVKRAATDLLETLGAQKAWLTHHLGVNVITRSTGKGGHDGDGNSWAAAAIPTWDVRQRIDEIDAAIQLAEGS